jgi:hypothetical protein
MKNAEAYERLMRRRQPIRFGLIKVLVSRRKAARCENSLKGESCGGEGRQMKLFFLFLIRCCFTDYGETGVSVRGIYA